MKFIDYFKVLGVSITATDEEIKTAYKKLSKKFHPDMNLGDKYFEERFKEVQEAYEVLIDPIKKAKYLIAYNNFFKGSPKEEPKPPRQEPSPAPKPQPVPPPQVKKRDYSWTGWIIGFFVIMFMGTMIRQAAHEANENKKTNLSIPIVYDSTVNTSDIEPAITDAKTIQPVDTPKDEKVINFHGTYSFDKAGEINSLDFPELDHENLVSSSIDFFVDNEGIGKMFLFMENQTFEFIIRGCENSESHNGFTFDLEALSKENETVKLQAFMSYEEGDKVKIFALKRDEKPGWQAFINSNI